MHAAMLIQYVNIAALYVKEANFSSSPIHLGVFHRLTRRTRSQHHLAGNNETRCFVLYAA
jgi:hypothetical protein